MWMLVLIMLTEMGATEYVVERYLTERACGREKVRIELEMHKSYPQDHDFQLVCRKSGKQV